MKWYNDGQIYGYYDEDGRLIVVGESGTDEQLGTHDIDAANGNGYYDENGKYRAYAREE